MQRSALCRSRRELYLQNLASIQPRTSPKKFGKMGIWDFEISFAFSPVLAFEIRGQRTPQSASSKRPTTTLTAAVFPLTDISENALIAARRTAQYTWGICTRRAGKLCKARSRLYRSQSLQVLVNTLWKALDEIYTMHTFAPFSWNLVWLKRYINVL